MRQKIGEGIRCWFSSGNNIFKSDTTDALFYLILYIALPIFITAIDILDFPVDNALAAYPYTCVIISAANCFYDIRNRWDNNAASVQNTKLFIMGASTLAVGAYAIVEVLLISGRQILDMRCDGLLCIYFLACAVSFVDAICCFGTRLAILDHVSAVEKEVVVE